MTEIEKAERARCNGICCIADGEIHPFSSDLPTLLRAIEVAALVGLKVKFDEDHVKVLQQHLSRGRPPVISATFSADNPT